MKVKPDKHFGYVEIQDTCMAPDCDEDAVAVLPVYPVDAEPGVLWQCRDHALATADTFEAEGLEGPYPESLAIVRTCQVEVNGSPCGATATHVALFGARGGLTASSVCRRHVEE